MFKTPFLIHQSAKILSTLCLLSSLALCPAIPEGALFLFIVGCTWLALAQVAHSIHTTDLTTLNPHSSNSE
jgi:hypothetical protein